MILMTIPINPQVFPMLFSIPKRCNTSAIQNDNDRIRTIVTSLNLFENLFFKHSFTGSHANIPNKNAALPIALSIKLFFQLKKSLPVATSPTISTNAIIVKINIAFVSKSQSNF